MPIFFIVNLFSFQDSIGKETWKGFRANPVPKYLKSRANNREKNNSPGKKNPQEQKKKAISNVDMKKLTNAAQIWKKKPFEPSHPKRPPVAMKPPNLYTAARAAERQRFDELMREKERQREEKRKIVLSFSFYDLRTLMHFILVTWLLHFLSRLYIDIKYAENN